uniref:Glycosyl transferase family 1 n=1 Tax=uncultured Acetothermia bacterium TaxID=236499 RepID=H5SH24_9BACT|nr:glycosyl transferase family 1 [uncultured Acetothermia bacterium]
MSNAVQGKALFVATVYTHLTAFHIPFMKLLQSWGYEVHAAASSAEGRREEVEAIGVKCWDIPFVRSPVSLRNIIAYRKLKALLTQEQFDLIHVHTPMAAWLGRLAVKRTNQGPVLYTAHGFHFYRGAPWPYWLFYYPAERLAARWTDGLIVMNKEDLERAKHMGFKEGENLFYIHGVGVDLERFSSVPENGALIQEELGLEAHNRVVTCVAEFIPRKNHDFLLDAWKLVAHAEEKAHLLLVGEGRLCKAIESRVQQDRIPRVHFLGFRRDVPSILAASDILVLTSKHEGLARCIMEAMAAGKPVVATDVRGSRDLVEHEVTGLLVQLGDVEGLAQAILRLIRDPELRQRMGQAGREKIKAYSLDHVLQEMAIIYERYLLKKGPSL